MPNKMLIDATHPEETRVVVLRGNRVEEFDFEFANRKQLRGNIYLAKVTRVEPSLQAAFVDYGGNRHGFLAFGEIHPDYYQIPVADRQALIEEEERAQRAADAEADNRARRSDRGRPARRDRDHVRSAPVEQADQFGTMAATSEMMTSGEDSHEETGGPTATEQGEGEQITGETHAGEEAHAESDHGEAAHEHEPEHEPEADAPFHSPLSESQPYNFAPPSSPEDAPHVDSPETAASDEPHDTSESADASNHDASNHDASHADDSQHADDSHNGENGGNITEVSGHGAAAEDEVIESVGGADAMEEVPERTYRSRRQYKIQEVIKRRQVMLVQVVKEERGTKGAALTTYLSLAGRYSVLMPNTARGGGISRKITSAEDRRRLKEIAADLEVPEGMGVILRTAGAARTKTEVKRDFEYLLRLWETVRDLTLQSTAPTLVYEEGSLVKRSLRDLYNKDIDEILVAGEEAQKEAKAFMRMLMPSHAKDVKGYRDTLPIYARYGIESQLDAMFQPIVQLRSGGYIVINQAEALVAIDVNSGRATREHHIEDTALKTNVEAAEEVARQLRLRDLAGLIVIDFIDMDEKRNNRTVERRLKDALKHDRARIQVGHISHFGLLEMSRQRIRSSVLENSTEKCPHCGGTGHMRSVSSVALQLLRAIEEMLLKGATHNVLVRTRSEIALYLLNHKRAHLRALEERFQIAIMVNADATVTGQLSYIIDKGEQVHSPDQAKTIAAQSTSLVPVDSEEEEEDVVIEEVDVEDVETLAVEDSAEAESEEPASSESMRVDGDGEGSGEAEGNGRGRRRRRRGRGRHGGSEGRETREGGTFTHASEGEHTGGSDAGEASHGEASHGEDDHGEAGHGETGHAEPGHDENVHGENGMPVASDQANDDSEPRRRRRGRRGGRRRRGRDEGTHATSGSDPVSEFDAEHPAGEPEDHDRVEPSYQRPEAETAHPGNGRHEQPAEHQSYQAAELPPAPPPETATAEAMEPAAPRRRSTVRERPPIGDAEAPVPAQPPAEDVPPPVMSGPSEEESATQPRRSGWWSRRVFGKG